MTRRDSRRHLDGVRCDTYSVSMLRVTKLDDARRLNVDVLIKE